MASDDPFLFCPLGCLPFFSLWPLMTHFSFVHWVVCPSLYGLWWALSLLFIGLCPSLYGLWWAISLLFIGFSVLLLFMASDETFLFSPLGCLSFFPLWPLMNPFSFVHWVVCPSSLCGHWWTLSLLFIGLSVLLFMASDEPFLFCSLGCVLLFVASDEPFLFCSLGCLSFFFLWPLMKPFSFVYWVVCPSSLYGLWWTLSLLSIGLSVLLLFMASDDPFLFCPLGCLSFFFLWPLMTPFSFVHLVVCPSLYGLWWPLSVLSIGLSVLLLFMASDDPFLFCPLGCLSFSLWPLMSPFSFVHWVVSFSLWPQMSPFSFVHWVVCPSSFYGLWWNLSLLSIGLSVLLLFMASDEPFLFCPLGCLSFFSLWPLMTPFCFVHWVVCPSSFYGLWWPLSLLSIWLSVLLFMASDDPFLFCPLGCLSFFLWPLVTPFSFVHWLVCPSSLYDLWWPLSLLSIGLSVLLLFIASDEPFLFGPLGCLSSLWPLMTTFSFVHWVVCPSLYGLWWPLSLLSIALSVLLFMASDNPSLFCPLGGLFFSLWPLMTPLSFVHWVVCPSLYGLWWHLSLLSIGLSVLLHFMTSDDPFLFGPLGCLFFSLWPLMTPLSFVHWVVCPSSLYGLWWPLSLLSIGFSVLLFMASDEPFLFFPLGCLSFSLWPLMTPLSFVHWVVCPSLYGLWWALSLLSVGLSILLLFMTSDDHFLFCPLGCLSFFSLWPLMNPFSFVNWVVCPSLYGLWWALFLFSIGLSVLLFMTSDDPFLFCSLGCLSFSLWPPMTLSLLSIAFSVLLFMTSDDPFLFGPLGCLSSSLWPLMTPFSLVHWVVCPLWTLMTLSLLSIGLSVLLFMASDDPFLFCPLGYLSFFSLWPLMTPFSFVHWVVCPSSLYGLWWPISLLSIGLSVLLFMASDEPFLFCSLGCVLLFMASDEPFLFCSLGFLSFFFLWPLMKPFSFLHWVVCPSSLYGLWWTLSLLSIGLSVLLLFVATDEPFLFCSLGCLSFSLWPLMSPFSFVHWVVSFSLWPQMSPFSFVHWVVCPSSFYGLWWNLSLLSIGLSVLLLFMASDEPFLFCPLGCLSFFSLWPLMTPFCFVHWVVCPSSFYGLWWPLSLLSIWLSVLLFMASDDPFLFCPLGCLSFFSLWPLMTHFSFVHWVVCPSLYCLWWALSLLFIGLCPSLYGLRWALSLLFIGLSVLLLFMASDETFLFCPLGCLSFFSLWPLMNPFSFVHWVVCPSSLYGLWWPLSVLSIGLSVLLLFMASDDPFLFCPFGCLSFSLWPLMTPFCFVHWVVCPSFYGLWWPLSLLSIGLSALLLFMTSDDPFLFCPLGCLSFFSL